MSELKGFAFENNLRLSLPFDFVERCQDYGVGADSILALLRIWQDFDVEYLESSQLDWLLPETMQALLESGFLLKFTSDASHKTILLPGTPSGRDRLSKLEKQQITLDDLKPSAEAARERPCLLYTSPSPRD